MSTRIRFSDDNNEHIYPKPQFPYVLPSIGVNSSLAQHWAHNESSVRTFIEKLNHKTSEWKRIPVGIFA